MKKLIQSNQGFTIIELIVYMGLFSILVGIITSVFVSLLNNQFTAETTASTDENGKYILARLTYDIAQAQNVVVPGATGTQTNNLQLTINNINYSYSLDSSGNFQIKDITDNLPAYNLNDYDATVSGLLFKKIGNTGGKSTIQVNFSVVSNTVQKTEQTKAYETTIGTR